MKKLNNKGMTIVELLIGFVIVMIIFISLFSVVSTYRDRLQTEGYRNQLVTFQTTLYKAIYDDIKNVSNPLTGVTSGTNCSDVGKTDSPYRVCFTYSDGNIIELAVIENEDKKQIYYDGITYDIPDQYYVQFVPVDSGGNNFVVTNNPYDGKQLFTIDFELEHMEINNADFGLHIVGTY